MKVERKLETFSKIIEEDAQYRRKAMLEEIDAKTNLVLGEFEKREKAEAVKKIEKAKAEQERLVNREISIHANENRRMLLGKRQELEARLFAQIEKEIAEYTTEEEYKENLIRAIDAQINERPCEIIVKRADYERLFADGTRGNAVSEADDIFIGGYKVILKDKGMIIDNTYDFKLAEAKETFKGLKI